MMVTDGDENLNARIDTESTNSQIEKSFRQSNLDDLKEIMA